jgi:homoserine dehydrogenase
MITQCLADKEISVDALSQKAVQSFQEKKPSHTAQIAQTDLVLLTHLTEEKRLNQALEQISASEMVLASIVKLRLEVFDISASLYS